MEISANDRPVSYVEAGACVDLFDESKLIRCAFEDDCENDDGGANVLSSEFVSSFELKAKIPSLVSQCHLEDDGFDNPPPVITIGKCTAKLDGNTCTSSPSNCFLASKFEPNSIQCTLRFNNDPSALRPLSVYGTCEERSTSLRKCVWSSDDCPGMGTTHDFTPASAHVQNSASSNWCTCDKVETGACKQQKNGPNDVVSYSCAVSAKSCDSESTWVTAAELAAEQSDEDAPLCKLCRPFRQQNNDSNNSDLPPVPTIRPAPAPQPCPAVPSSGCSVCGPNQCVSAPEAVFEFTGQPPAPCGDLQNAGYSGQVDKVLQCPSLPSLIKDVCGCIPSNGEVVSNPITSGVPTLTKNPVQQTPIPTPAPFVLTVKPTPAPLESQLPQPSFRPIEPTPRPVFDDANVPRPPATPPTPPLFFEGVETRHPAHGGVIERMSDDGQSLSFGEKQEAIIAISVLAALAGIMFVVGIICWRRGYKMGKDTSIPPFTEGNVIEEDEAGLVAAANEDKEIL